MSLSKSLNPIQRIFIDSRKQWLGLTGIFFFSLLAGPFKVIAATVWGQVVDLSVSGRLDEIIPTSFFILFIVLLDAVRTSVHYKIIGRTVEKMFYYFRLRAFTVLADGDVCSLEECTRTGDLAMRISGDLENLCDIISSEYPNLLRLISQVGFAIFGCFLLSWQLSLALFTLIPISLWFLRKMSASIKEQSKTVQGKVGKAVSLATEVMGGLATVKSYNIQQEMNEHFTKNLEAAYDETVKIEKIGIRMNIVKYMFGVAQTMVLFLVGSILVSYDIVTIGEVISFVALSVYITEALGLTDRMFRMYRTSSALAGRLYEVLDIPAEQSGTNDALIISGENDEIMRMEGVTFAYGDASPVLKDINIRLLNNQKVALIGPSGCGKSTLIKLICHFYTQQKGEFTQFTINAKEINIRTLRRELALVTQDAILFDGSIYDNIAYGRLDVSEGEVMQAIKNSHLWDFINSLPSGMHTSVGEFGSRLSGGQRQRVCIARAMLKNARVILLDEATSALDTKAEHDIQKALDALLVNRSAVIVAHRLSTIQNADYIYCLNDGKILEEGTPLQLFAEKGYYYRICMQQDIIREGSATV